MLNMAPNLVKFTAHKMRGTVTLWRNREALERAGFSSWTDESFAEHFSWGIRTNPSFATIQFDGDDSATLMAERYGGFGMGRHGGGARVGNFGGFQIKGVGRNPLAGDSDGSVNGEFHGHGAFSLVDAICEVVNSELYGKLLPLGTVPCYGLILSGRQAAYYPQRADTEPSAGVLMVRGSCARPAHFLRASHFRMSPGLLLSIGNDVARVRDMSRALQAHVGNDSGFVKYLANFLKGCAKQFAFARLWRINHGSVTPSNLAMDGRWLDMMGTSFMEAGMDYAPSPALAPFSAEAQVVKAIAVELADTYAKYVRTGLPVDNMIGYYDKQYEAFLAAYLPWFFGISPNGLESFGRSSHSGLLLKEVLAALSGGLRLTDELPQKFDPDDPAIALADRLFRELGRPEGSRQPAGEAFRALVDAAYERRPDPDACRSVFESTLSIACLKRLYFSSSFFRGRLIGQASSVLLGGEDKAVLDMIEEWRLRSEWVFNLGGREDHVIVDVGRLKLTYRPSGELSLETDGATRVFSGRAGFSDVTAIIAGMPECALSLPAYFGFPPTRQYSFRRGVLHILALLAALQRD